MKTLGSVAKGCSLLVLSTLLVGCAFTPSQMVRATAAPQLDAGKALLTFLRPSNYGGAVSFGIWDSEQFLGELKGESSVSCLVSPGEHVFLAKAENWAVTKAQLAAGKRYYLLMRPRMGIMKAGVIMDPVKSGTSDSEIAGWQRESKLYAPDPAKVDAYTKEWLPQVRKAIENYKAGRADFNVLEAADGR
jgi:hypothetical protein